MEKRAEEILGQNRDKVDKLAKALLEQETLTRSEIDRLLGLASQEPATDERE